MNRKIILSKHFASFLVKYLQRGSNVKTKIKDYGTIMSYSDYIIA